LTADSPEPRKRPATRRPRRQATRPASLISTPGPEPTEAPERVRLTVGTIVGAHGVAGELKLKLATDDPGHLATIKRVFVGDEERPRRLRGFRLHGDLALIHLAGITTREAAEDLRGRPVRIAGTDARPLEPGEFFLYQLIGLRVETETGEPIGVVTDLIETGAHGVFVITPDGGGAPILLPNHPDVVLDIRPDERRMIARPLIYDE
jgi:16S rRNA processing protein RimM